MKPKTEQLQDLLAKVTPGDWNAECRSVSDGSLVVKDQEFNEICVVADKSERVYGPLDFERQANAKMLAIAPSLAREVIELARYISIRVHDTFGIMLTPEPTFIGFD